MGQTVEEIKETFYKEILEFEEVGQKFVDGEISSAEFKAVSGGMGVYAQRGGKLFMIRLRILSGLLDGKTLKLIRDFAYDFSLRSIHLTTRQAIQLHDLQFDQVISIMKKSLENDLFTRGGGGNFPRNVALSPLSGVDKDEAFDPSPYALRVNNYFISKMNTYKLPRKLKVAFSNNQEDTANATIADLGFIAVRQNGKTYFKLYIGGSLGPNGEISIPYEELVDPSDILYHIEAITNLFIEEGDYQNKGKARIRYIVKRMGKKAFLDCYEKHLSFVKESGNLGVTVKPELNQEVEPVGVMDITESANLISQKQKGLYTLILHPIAGILKAEDLKSIAEFLEHVPLAQIHLGMDESMYIRNLTNEQARELSSAANELVKSTRLKRSISCIGTPTCQIGIQQSQKLLKNILDLFEEKGILEEDLLPAVSISGCINSCARHQVCEIGFQGKKKKINEVSEDVFALYVLGKVSQEDTHLAEEQGDMLAETIPAFLVEVALVLRERHVTFYEYLKDYQEDFENCLKKYLV
ncbi:MAG: nitrite/sulfite reductase [Eubacteriaceae bacterium]|nr:nitrite/sulfite reductase [Eubacteriaceae bacterium]